MRLDRADDIAPDPPGPQHPDDEIELSVVDREFIGRVTDRLLAEHATTLELLAADDQ